MKISLSLLTVLLFTLLASAQTNGYVKFGWIPTTSTNALGYRLYYITNSVPPATNWTQIATFTPASATNGIALITPGFYCFYLKTFDEWEESLPSNIACTWPPPPPPSNFILIRAGLTNGP